MSDVQEQSIGGFAVEEEAWDDHQQQQLKESSSSVSTRMHPCIVDMTNCQVDYFDVHEVMLLFYFNYF